ncbi:hypothetical protein NHQ30_008063 [Ciborinia camelliae]|nr:hypothetical protein NHQ30_008063 [Ciborinia camelliae]
MSQITPSLTNLPPEVLALLGSTPSIPPPDGVSPNFVDPHSKGSTQIAVTSVILSIMLLFFINRVYVKVVLMKKVTWDDGTLVLGVVMTIVFIPCIELRPPNSSLAHHRSYASHFLIYQDELLHLISTSLQSATVASNLFLVRLGYNGDNVCGPDHYRVCLFNTSTWRVMVNTPDFGWRKAYHQAVRPTVRYWTYTRRVHISASYGRGFIPSNVTQKKVWRYVYVLFWCHGLYMLNLQHLLSTYFNLERGHNLAPHTCQYLNIVARWSSFSSLQERRAAANVPIPQSMYRKLLRIITIPFESFRSTLRESKNSSISSRMRTRPTHKNDEENALKSTDRKYARYFNLDILASDGTGTGTQNTGTSLTTVTGSPHATVAEVNGIQR